MNCEECVFHGKLPRTHHLECNLVNFEDKIRVAVTILQGGRLSFATDDKEEIAVDFNLHGIANGWCHWPLNFDPIWVDKCLFFTSKPSKFMAEQQIEVTPENYKELKKAYDKAVAEGVKSFMFKEHELLVAYAKYVLEYMKMTLKL